jgi:hypothetical protein
MPPPTRLSGILPPQWAQHSPIYDWEKEAQTNIAIFKIKIKIFFLNMNTPQKNRV